MTDIRNENASGVGGVDAKQGNNNVANTTAVHPSSQPDTVTLLLPAPEPTCFDFITVYTDSKQIGKGYTVKDGEVVKTTSAAIGTAAAQTVHIPDLHALQGIIESLRPEQAISLGFIPGTEDGTPYTIYSMANLRQLVVLPEGAKQPVGLYQNGSGYIAARLKANFRLSSYALLDRDPDDAMPDNIKAADYNGWLVQLVGIVPQLAGAGILYMPSSSGRVLNQDGTPACVGGESSHTYVKVDNPLKIPLLASMLKINSWCQGLGYIKPNSIDRPMRRTIVDTSVFTPERLVFEAAPTVSDGLQLAASQSVVVEGGLVATSSMPPVTDAQKARYKELTGLTVKTVDDNGVSTTMVSTTDLGYHDMLDTEYGQMTVAMFEASDYEKVRCQTPYRDSTSMAAFLGRTKDRKAFLHDIGDGTTYFPSQDPAVVFSASAVSSAETPRGQAPATSRPARSLSIVKASDVTIKDLQWVWEGVIVRGMLNLIGGDPGLGKSLLTLMMASHITQGRKWPKHGPECVKGDVLILSGEDPAEDVLVPRLIAAGADLERVTIVQGVEVVMVDGQRQVEAFSIDTCLAELAQQLIANPNIQMLTIDPVNSYLGSGIDSFKDAEVRSILQPLADLANKYDIAVVMVTHLTKSNAKAVHRFLGSIGFVGISRSVLGVSKSKDDESLRLVTNAKINIGKDGSGFAYRIREVPVEGLEKGQPQLVVDPHIDPGSAEKVMGDAKNNAQHLALQEATEFLREELNEGPVPSGVLRERAEDAGLNWRTVERAKQALSIDAKRLGDKKRWHWVMTVKEVDCEFLS